MTYPPALWTIVGAAELELLLELEMVLLEEEELGPGVTVTIRLFAASVDVAYICTKLTPPQYSVPSP